MRKYKYGYETYQYSMECPCGNGNLYYFEVVDPGHYSGPPEYCYPREVVEEYPKSCDECGHEPTADEICVMLDGDSKLVNVKDDDDVD